MTLCVRQRRYPVALHDVAPFCLKLLNFTTLWYNIYLWFPKNHLKGDMIFYNLGSTHYYVQDLKIKLPKSVMKTH